MTLKTRLIKNDIIVDEKLLNVPANAINKGLNELRKEFNVIKKSPYYYIIYINNNYKIEYLIY